MDKQVEQMAKDIKLISDHLLTIKVDNWFDNVARYLITLGYGKIDDFFCKKCNCVIKEKLDSNTCWCGVGVSLKEPKEKI